VQKARKAPQALTFAAARRTFGGSLDVSTRNGFSWINAR
jgi:hypothetical protein